MQFHVLFVKRLSFPPGSFKLRLEEPDAKSLPQPAPHSTLVDMLASFSMSSWLWNHILMEPEQCTFPGAYVDDACKHQTQLPPSIGKCIRGKYSTGMRFRCKLRSKLPFL